MFHPYWKNPPDDIQHSSLWHKFFFFLLWFLKVCLLCDINDISSYINTYCLLKVQGSFIVDTTIYRALVFFGFFLLSSPLCKDRVKKYLKYKSINHVIVQISVCFGLFCTGPHLCTPFGGSSPILQWVEGKDLESEFEALSH